MCHPRIIVVAVLQALFAVVVSARCAKCDEPLGEDAAAQKLEAIKATVKRTDGHVTGVGFSSDVRATPEHFQLLRNFPEISTVSWGGVPLTDELIESLAALPKLNKLVIGTGSADPEGLSRLERLDTVKELQLGSFITDEAMSQIHFPPHVESIMVTSIVIEPKDRLTDAGVAHLAKATELRRLSLRAPRVTDAGLGQLKGLRNLRQIYVHNSVANGAFLREWPWREQIEALGGENFTDESVANLLDLKKLRHLHLGRMPEPGNGESKLTDACTETIARLKMLEGLSLMNSAVTDAGLKNLTSLDRLEYLTLGHCRGVTDVGLEHLAQLKNLKGVSLDNTSVTPAGAKALKSALPDIRIHPPQLLK